MPRYQYKCLCGEGREEFMKMCGEAEAPRVFCHTCLGVMHRIPTLTHTDLKEFFKPIEMYSIASEDPAEIRRMKSEGIEVSDDPRDEMYGVPIARNRHDKLKALKATGFVETK